MGNSRPVALVTGGAKRVGAAIVRRLAAAGYDIAFTYHASATEAQSLVAELAGLNCRAQAIPADLTHPQTAVPAALTELRRVFGRCDLLVHSASLYTPASLADTTLDLIRQLNAIHLETPLLLCQALEADLRQARGAVVMMGDLLAEKPWPAYLAYCASKAALSNLTLGLARTLAPDVTVNAIAPGVVDWPPDYPDAEKEKYLRRVPLARPGTPADVAHLVHYLATEGKYITGQILRLDGGRSIT